LVFLVDPSDEEIQRFKDAWEKDLGESLSIEAAQSELGRLLHFLYELAEAFPNQLTEKE
jgi:hypothetical protein